MIKNPKYVYGSFDFSVPVNINCGEYLLKKLIENGNKCVINAGTNESISYRDIAQQAMNLALSLSSMGAGKGEVIAICSENCLEFWPAVVGSVCTGASCSPISWAYSSGEMKHVLNVAKPKFMICSSMAYKKHNNTFQKFNFKKVIVLGNEAPKGTILFSKITTVSADGLKNNVLFEDFQVPEVIGQIDEAFILYSSGTTGLPKGVLLTHWNVLAGTTTFYQLNSEPDDSTMIVSPWSHTMSLFIAQGLFIMGRNLLYIPRFDVEQYLDAIERYRITNLIVAPPILVSISKIPELRDLSSVKIIDCGAATLLKDTLDDVSKRFPNGRIMQGYGMSECTQAIIRDADVDKAKSGGIGVPTVGSIVKVVDINTRKPLGPNQEGEICIKGPRLMKGYINKDKALDFDSEGFFKTGDIGYYDEDKYFFIVDRLKELIKYKGYQVAPAEIEAVLLQHEAVKDAGVIGIPNRDAGEVPLAFLVLKPGASVSEKEIQDFVAERLSHTKRLRGGVRFINEIPKNPSGKILRRVLRNNLKSGKSKL